MLLLATGGGTSLCLNKREVGKREKDQMGKRFSVAVICLLVATLALGGSVNLFFSPFIPGGGVATSLFIRRLIAPPSVTGYLAVRFRIHE